MKSIENLVKKKTSSKYKSRSLVDTHSKQHGYKHNNSEKRKHKEKLKDKYKKTKNERKPRHRRATRRFYIQPDTIVESLEKKIDNISINIFS